MKTVNLTRQGAEPEEGDFIRIEHENGVVEEKYFYPTVAIPDTYLKVELPAEGVVGESFTIRVSVQFADETLVNVNTSYYVPLVRESDNLTVSFHKVTFVAGEAELTIIPTSAGKLTVSLDQIEPRPTAKLPTPPFIYILSEA